MSIHSWNQTWGKLVPLIQKKVSSQTENNLLDVKIEHEIENLLSKKAKINDLSPMIQCTFLHLCIGKGLIKSALKLIKNGADLYKDNLFHEKPLDYIAHAKYNQERMKKLFLRQPTCLTHKKTR